MGIGEVITLIVGGTIIGLIGKAFAPGDRDKTPLWLTVLCGVGGIFLGNLLYVVLFNFDGNTAGFDWWRHAWQVAAAAALVALAATLTSRSKVKV